MPKRSTLPLIFSVTSAVAVSLIFWPELNYRLDTNVYSANFPSYLLRQHSRILGPHGDRILQNIITYQSTDGSRVIETHDLVTGMDDRQIIHSSGLVQTVYDKIKVVSSTKETSPHYLIHKGTILDPATNCLLPYTGKLMFPYSLLGQEKIGGVMTNKILAGKDSGLILWNAPSLGCVTLRQQRTFADSASTLEFDSLSLSAPDPQVFTVPSDYEELIPSQAKFKLLKSASIAIPDADIADIVSRLSRVDADYASKRP